MNSLKPSWRSSPGIRRVLPLLLLTVLWGGAIGFDWVIRFHWFEWHRYFLVKTFKPRFMGDGPVLGVVTNPPGKGGDLSRLLETEEAMQSYGVERPDEGVIQYDEYGFPNKPPTTNTYFPVVLVGDSFLLQGRDSSKLLGSLLERRLGVPVYTLAHAGRGAAFSMAGFVDHPEFRKNPPRSVVWFVPERDASAFFFDSMAAQIMHRVYETNFVLFADAATRRGVEYSEFKPERLQVTLPNTSALASKSRQVWTRLWYAFLGAPPDSVVVSQGQVDGHSLLFYRENLKSLAWSDEVRDIPEIQRVVFHVNKDYFAPRGIHWLIVLIPEKEQVYRGLIPPRPLAEMGEVPASFLPVMASAVREQGVASLDLLEFFAPLASKGELLYWPDDTHWNDRGMETAAEAIGHELLSINLITNGLHAEQVGWMTPF